MILPLQGAALMAPLSPRALPWAMRFCPFGAYVTRAEGTFYAAQPPSIYLTTYFFPLWM